MITEPKAAQGLAELECADAEGDTAELIELPGKYRRWEIGELLTPESYFRIEPSGRTADGTPLYTVYRRAVGSDERTAQLVDVSRLRDLYRKPTTIPPAQLDDQTLGELKARQAEEHLCLKCFHYQVCGMAQSLAPDLLVTIGRCRGFVAAQEVAVSEIVPIVPLS